MPYAGTIPFYRDSPATTRIEAFRLNILARRAEQNSFLERAAAAKHDSDKRLEEHAIHSVCASAGSVGEQVCFDRSELIPTLRNFAGRLIPFL